MAGALRYLSLRALLLLAGGFLAIVVFGQRAEAATPDLTGALADVPSLEPVTSQTLPLPTSQTSKPAELVTAAGGTAGEATKVAAANDPGQAGSLSAVGERPTGAVDKAGKAPAPIGEVQAPVATPVTKKAAKKAGAEPVTPVAETAGRLAGDVAGSTDGPATDHLAKPRRGSTDSLAVAAVPVVPVSGPMTGQVGKALETVAPILTPVTRPVGKAVESIPPVLAPVTGPVGKALDSVAPVLAPVTGSVGETLESVAPVLAPVTGSVGETLEPVPSVLAPVTRPVGEAVDTAPPALDPVTGPVTSAAEGAAPPVADVASPVDGDLAPPSGPQPSMPEPVFTPPRPLLVPADLMGTAAGAALPTTLVMPARLASRPLSGKAWRGEPLAEGSPSAGRRAQGLPASLPVPGGGARGMLAGGLGHTGGHGGSDAAAILAVLTLLPLWLGVHMRRTCLLFSSAVGLPLDRPG
jgi:hypothetical protein